MTKTLGSGSGRRRVPCGATGRPADRLTVLVVDSEPTQREAIADYLRACGHEVVEAMEGHSALRHGFECHHHLDALVIDPVLPGRMGAAVAHDLSAQLPELITIYISDYDREYAVPERFFGRGRSAFFVKPFSYAKLEYTLCRLVRALEPTGARPLSPLALSSQPA